MWKAFDEMERLGWIGSERPQMIVVQAAGCAPIVRAFERGETLRRTLGERGDHRSGHPRAVGGRRLSDPRCGARESGGTALTVTDEEMLEAMREMGAAEGIWPAPEGAATLAGYRKLREAGVLTEETENGADETPAQASSIWTWLCRFRVGGGGWVRESS